MKKKTVSITSPKTSFGTGNLSTSWKKLSPGSTGKNLPSHHPAAPSVPFHPCGKKSLWRIWQIPVWQTRHITTGLPKIESCAIIDLSFSGTDFHGDVAQLGERTVRIRKVESSILFVSTMPFGARQNRSRLAAAGLLFLLMYFNCTRTLPRKPPRRKYRDAKYISQTIFPLDICRKKML